MNKEISYYIKSMDCINEENDIRRLVQDLKGIHRMDFQLSKRVLLISMDQDAQKPFENIMKRGGYPVEALANKKEKIKYIEEIKLGFSLLLALISEVLTITSNTGMTLNLVVSCLSFLAICLSGVGVYKKGILALVKLKLSINGLMTIAVTGAFLIGEWPEAAMVSSLFSIAELIESKAVDRARGSIRKLLAILPDKVEVMRESGWSKVNASDIASQSKIRVRPGERIPLDGIIVEGASEIDQSPVTGESVAVHRKAGDKVFAGSINLSGMFIFRNTTTFENNTVSRIIELVENTQSKKAPLERFVDKFSKRYTPLVFFISLFVLFAGPYLFGWTYQTSIYKALVLLVIACPCALVISIPITIVSALTKSAQIGVLMKGGHAIEQLSRLKAIAFDKTGTITSGSPSLLETIIIAKELNGNYIRELAYGLSSLSDHPVSKAISEGLVGTKEVEVKEFKAIAGQGIEANFQNNKILLGNKKLVESLGLCSESILAEISRLESKACSVSLLILNRDVIALFGVTDKVKSGSFDAIQKLKGLGVHVVMLSGDNSKTAQIIAQQVGIDDARGDLLPQDKLLTIQELQKNFGITGMTGDGINDSPAIAQADLGFAMGKIGTDSAKETADVVIVGDDLRKIPEVILLAKKAHVVLWQNIMFSIGIKILFFILTILGITSMWMAVFADVGATLLVVFNGLRLLGTEKNLKIKSKNCFAKACC